MIACLARCSSELKAEPNLTPLLDVVFQLITFFMLVINFSSENYDQRVRLPVADSARPIDDYAARLRRPTGLERRQRGPPADRRRGPAAAQGTPDHQASGRPGQAEPQGRGGENRRTRDCPTTIIFRADRDATFGTLIALIKGCQSNGFRKFALKAMNAAVRRTDRWRRGGPALSERKNIQKSEGPDDPDHAHAGHGVPASDVLRADLRPAPSEGQFVMNLLPAQPATAITAEAPSDKPSEALPATLAHASHDAQGRRRGAARRRSWSGKRRLRPTPKRSRPSSKSTSPTPTFPFEQTMLKVDPRLRYSELMRVVNAFMNAFSKAKKPPNISWDELAPGEGE